MQPENPYRLLATEIVAVLLKDYRRADAQQRVCLRSCLVANAEWVRYCVSALGLVKPRTAQPEQYAEDMERGAQNLLTSIAAQMKSIDQQQ